MIAIKKKKIHSKKSKHDEDVRRGQEGMDTEGPSPQRGSLSRDPRGKLSEVERDIIDGNKNRID